MKKIVFITMLFLSGSLFAQTGTIKVTLKGINTTKGKEIRLAMYNKAGFLMEMLIQKKVLSKGTEATFLLDDIKVGKYAIAVFQDENSDGKMNTNFIGKPKELSGFSNNATGNFGPPKFKDAVFTMAEGETTRLIIHLKN